ncbi:MAG TPA: hypothetical protein ENK05_01300 [Gammaproteobacteria bacterium]|nr:hypothetical protein [Gammaproteobacteria bacterium]
MSGKGVRIRAWLLSWLEQCLLRRAPQDDALSWSALAWAALAYATTDLLQAAASSSWVVAVGMTALDVSVLMLFTSLVLRLTHRRARYPQTLTALFGTGAVLGLLGLPLVHQAASAGQDEAPVGLLVLGWLFLLGWSIAVQAHIFRHALSSRYATGLLLAGLHTVLVIVLLEVLFPRAG